MRYESSGRSGHAAPRRGVGRSQFCAAAAVLLALVICGVKPAAAAAFDYNDTSWEGCSEFLGLARQRLGAQRTLLVPTVEFGELRPGDGILILHPTVSLHMEALNDFMLSGGRVAILDDFGAAGPFLEHFGIRRSNPPLRPEHTLRGNPNLAWAVPSNTNAEPTGDSPHGLVVGLSRLLTNHPSTITNPGLTPVLEIRATDGSAYPLAVSGVIGQRGRLFVMGDPSVLINEMLRYPENRQFAERVVDYLVMDDSWGARGGRLYLLANDFALNPSRRSLLAPDRISGEANAVWLRLMKARIPEYVAWGLGSLVAMIIGRKAWLHMGRRVTAYRPRFASKVPLVSQPGAAGRAAVLGARSTPRALVVLELMSGMTAYLASALDLPDAQPSVRVFEMALERKLLNQSQHDALNSFSKHVIRLQSVLATGGQARVARQELKRWHRLMLDIVNSIEHRDASDFRATSDAPRN